jgi:hypothetical protein
MLDFVRSPSGLQFFECSLTCMIITTFLLHFNLPASSVKTPVCKVEEVHVQDKDPSRDDHKGRRNPKP